MKIYLIILFLLTFAKCKIEEGEEIKIDVNEDSLYYFVGSKEGKFGFKTNKIDDSNFFSTSDIEEKTKFNLNLNITDENNIYHLNCRLWKDDKEFEIYIFCGLQEDLKNGEGFKIHESVIINYNSKNVTINFEINYLELIKIEGKLPFLYGSSQTFILEDNQKVIDREFKIDSYNDEPLFIQKDRTLIPIENCRKENEKKLKCQILKEKLDIIANKSNSYEVGYLSENLGYYYFEFVKNIEIQYSNIQKEDIHLSFVKLINSKIGADSFYHIETNIRNMDKIKTINFQIKLYKEEDIEADCFFIKHNKASPLYMSCHESHIGNFSIDDKTGFLIDNLHYKYNFILEIHNFTEEINIEQSIQSGIDYIYPETLDFSIKNPLKIYIKESGSENENIALNEEGNYLECENRQYVKICNVPKDHFKGKENGYYLLHHKDDEENTITDYEAFGVNVILSKIDNGSKIRNFSLGLSTLLCLLALL